MRMEPAMSVPTPMIEPLMARRAPSPPLDPPAVRDILLGLSVRPKRLLSESAVCGDLVASVQTLILKRTRVADYGRNNVPSLSRAH